VRGSFGVSVTQPVTIRSLESAKCWSEWQDLNLRLPRPERGALPDYATIRRRMGQSWPEVLVVGRPYQGKNNVLADSRGHAI
jgi:hypothetical protein